MKGDICSINGCNKTCRTGAICHNHQWRMRTHGSYDKPSRKRYGEICQVENCNRPRDGRHSICGLHRIRKERYGSYELPVKEKIILNTGIVKICKKHGELTEENAYRHPTYKGKYFSCKLCRRISEKEMHRRNPHRKCNKNFYYLRGTTIKISKKEYEEMSLSQGNVCKICRQLERMKSKDPKYWKREEGYQRRLVLDHEHGSNELRGLLCAKCNLMLGYAQDDTKILQSAIDYLNKHKETT